MTVDVLVKFVGYTFDFGVLLAFKHVLWLFFFRCDLALIEYGLDLKSKAVSVLKSCKEIKNDTFSSVN